MKSKKKKPAKGVNHHPKKVEKRLSKSQKQKRIKAKALEEKALSVYGRTREYLNPKDIKTIEILASKCVPEQAIATIVGIGLNTLRTHFQLPIKKGRAKMQASLLSVTFQSAMNGNVVAQIWLSKQDAVGLHFTDKLRTENTGRDRGPLQYETMNTSELWGIISEAAAQGRLTKEQMRRIGFHETSSPV